MREGRGEEEEIEQKKEGSIERKDKRGDREEYIEMDNERGKWRVERVDRDKEER